MLAISQNQDFSKSEFEDCVKIELENEFPKQLLISERLSKPFRTKRMDKVAMIIGYIIQMYKKTL